MIALISVEDWFGYVFGTVIAVGLACLLIIFLWSLFFGGDE